MSRAYDSKAAALQQQARKIGQSGICGLETRSRCAAAYLTERNSGSQSDAPRSTAVIELQSSRSLHTTGHSSLRRPSIFRAAHSAKMASVVRQAMLRQSILSAPPKRIITAASVLPKSYITSTRPSSTSLQQRQPRPSNASITSRIATFHSTARHNILPPGPQVIEGGVNDPAPVPKPHPTEGSYHWVFERLLCVGLIPLTIAPFAAG